MESMVPMTDESRIQAVVKARRDFPHAVGLLHELWPHLFAPCTTCCALFLHDELCQFDSRPDEYCESCLEIREQCFERDE